MVLFDFWYHCRCLWNDHLLFPTSRYAFIQFCNDIDHFLFDISRHAFRAITVGFQSLKISWNHYSLFVHFLGKTVSVVNGFEEFIRSQNEKQNDFNYLFNIFRLLDIFNSRLQSSAKERLALRASVKRIILFDLIKWQFSDHSIAIWSYSIGQ